MRNLKLFLLIALLGAGCGGGGKQLDTARINSQTRVKARWVVTSRDYNMELQFLADGESYRLHKKSEKKGVRREMDVVSDGSSVWVFNQPKTSSGKRVAFKHDLSPGELAELPFWQVDGSKSWKSETPGSVEGVMCVKYLHSEQSDVLKDTTLLTRIWVDETRGVVLKIEKNVIYKGELGTPRTFLCKELELNPSVKAEDFLYVPTTDETLKSYATPMHPFTDPMY